MGGRTEKLKGRTVTSQPLTWNTVYDPGQPVLLQTEDQPDMWEQAVCYATEFIDGIVQYTVIVGVENEAPPPPPPHPPSPPPSVPPPPPPPRRLNARPRVRQNWTWRRKGTLGRMLAGLKAPSSMLDVDRVAKEAVAGRSPIALGDEGAPRLPPWTI